MTTSVDDDRYEEMLFWNWDKRPSTPEIRAELASMAHRVRAAIFEHKVVPLERRQALATFRTLYRQGVADLVAAEAPARRAVAGIRSEWELWLRHSKPTGGVQ